MATRIPKHIVAIVILVVLLLLISSSLWNNGNPKIEIPADLKGVMVEDPPPPMPQFQLTDQNGSPFATGNLLGKWSYLFFGYTSCPDICPNSLRVLNTLSAQSDMPKNAQYIFVSVDPKRDSQEKIKDFIQFFNPSFIGLRGEPQTLHMLTEPLGAVYEYVYEGEEQTGDYLVNHFAAIYVVNPKAELVAYILPPHEVDRLSQAAKLIARAYGD